MNSKINNTKIYIIAGESSGDLHASNVMQELKKINPSFEFRGIGGDKMISEGLDLQYHIKDLGFMGIWEVLKHFFLIKKLFSKIKKDIINTNPAVVLLVDFSEFNLKMGKTLRNYLNLDTVKTKFKIVRYVSPQIWASRSKRIDDIVYAYDSLCCILPFEKKLYNGYDIDARYVGHPLLDQYRINIDFKTFKTQNGINLLKNQKIISIFPGSRQQEIDKHLVTLIKSVKVLKNRSSSIGLEYEFLICKSNEIILKDEFLEQIDELGIKIIDSKYQWEVMKYSDFILCKSGTSTLQAIIAGTPALVFYKMNALTFAIGKRIVKIKYIGLANIIANKEIYPELIQDDFNETNVAEITEFFLLNKDNIYYKTLEEIGEARSMIGEKGASKKVAVTVLDNIV